MSISRKAFIAGLLALIPAKAAAQIQTVGNNGQIVSTGDVWVQQDAAGNQVAYNTSGQIIGQGVGNDLQVVATGSVTVGQRAAGSQTVYGSSGICEPGEFVIHGCSIEICTERCEWTLLKCPGCRDKGCRKC